MKTKYITIRRAKFNALCGKVNIPRGTDLEEEDGFLLLSDKPICTITSQNAHNFFAQNRDGCGQKRGYITAAIITSLSKRDKEHQERWDRVWEDPICQKYKRKDHVDFWVWDHTFFEASIEDLQHIAKLVGAKG